MIYNVYLTIFFKYIPKPLILSRDYSPVNLVVKWKIALTMDSASLRFPLFIIYVKTIDKIEGQDRERTEEGGEEMGKLGKEEKMGEEEREKRGRIRTCRGQSESLIPKLWIPCVDILFVVLLVVYLTFSL